MAQAKVTTKKRMKDIIKQIEEDTTYDPLKTTTNTVEDIYAIRRATRAEQLDEEMKR